LENVVGRVLTTRTIRAGAMLLLLVLSGTSAAGTTGKMRMAYLALVVFAGSVLLWTFLRSPKNDT
jgi:hypothetical protein